LSFIIKVIHCPVLVVIRGKHRQREPWAEVEGRGGEEEEGARGLRFLEE